jgi:hypothetical protein
MVIADFGKRIEAVFSKHDIESSLAEKCFRAAAYRIAVIDHQYFDVFIHLA